MSIGFDFKDTYLQCGELEIAVRLFTTTQAYAPDPQRSRIVQEENGVRLTAGGLIWAGGQEYSDGSIELRIEKNVNGHWEIHASGSHLFEPCKSMLVMVQGLELTAVIAGDAAHERFAVPPRGNLLAGHYPVFKMPLVFLETAQGDWFAISRETRARKKSFGTHFDFIRNRLTLDLAHQEDARQRAHSIETPTWVIGRCTSREEIVRARCAQLESDAGLKPWQSREDVPAWFHEVQLVAHLHGEHWTGFIFNSFEQMGRKLEWFAERIGGHRILAFLPAWDGRYYFNYPKYEPSQRMGGSAGLRAFVNKAHELGAHVVPMLGANAANIEYLREAKLDHTIIKDDFGIPQYCDWVDWDFDLSPESHTVMANIGHPDFRRHLVERSSYLIEEFGVDGIFLDISGLWRNCPDYAPHEGVLLWAAEMRERCPDILLMGEYGYDLLWNTFACFAEGRAPLGHCDSLLRYARSSYYLAHRAPGSESGGVHELAWGWNDLNDQNRGYLIPSIGVTEDILENHRAAAEAEIDFALYWRQQLPPIAATEE